MLFFTKEKWMCTGCTACKNVCPINCISMEPDEEGFLYPIASDKCIHCGKCMNSCPVLNKYSGYKTDVANVFAGVSKNKKVWKDSSSGGAFTSICTAFADEETLICGAAWEGLDVKHVCVIGVNNIAPLRKSKYVASNLCNTFSEIKKHLSNGKKPFFQERHVKLLV